MVIRIQDGSHCSLPLEKAVENTTLQARAQTFLKLGLVKSDEHSIEIMQREFAVFSIDAGKPMHIGTREVHLKNPACKQLCCPLIPLLTQDTLTQATTCLIAFVICKASRQVSPWYALEAFISCCQTAAISLQSHNLISSDLSQACLVHLDLPSAQAVRLDALLKVLLLLLERPAVQIKVC